MNIHSLMAPLLGGLAIGMSVALLLLGEGRIAGISGILFGVIRKRDEATRSSWLFLAGLLGGAIVFRLLSPAAFAEVPVATPTLLVAGLLVGFGTRLSGGCTSGHGVCGNSRLAPRSMVATCTFIGVAGVVVFLVRHTGAL